MWSSPALTDINGDGIADCVIGSNDSYVYCISGNDGNEIWKFKTGNMVYSSPVLTDISGDGIPDCIVASADSKIYCISGKDGKEIWSSKTSNSIWSSSALTDINGDGTPDCLVGSDDGYVYCISGKDGKEIWRFKTKNSIGSSPAFADINGDGIPDCMVGSYDSNVYCISGKDGKEIWRFKTGNYISSSPALMDINRDGIADCVVGSWDSNVYCISGKDGKEIWRFKTANSIWSSPALADINGDGIADCVIGSNDGSVYCIDGAVPRDIPPRTVFDIQALAIRTGSIEKLESYLQSSLPHYEKIFLRINILLQAMERKDHERAKKELDYFASIGYNSATISACRFIITKDNSALKTALNMDPIATVQFLNNRAIKIQSSDPSGLTTLASAAMYLLNGDYDLAQDMLNLYHRESPQLDRTAEVIHLLVKEFPTVAEPYISKAKQLEDSENFERAAKLYAMACEHLNGTALREAVESSAKCWKKAGKKSQAITQLE